MVAVMVVKWLVLQWLSRIVNSIGLFWVVFTEGFELVGAR